MSDRLAAFDATDDLERHAVRGGAAILAVQATQFVLSLASTAVLARLLAPSDFGLVAIAAAIAGVLELFLDLGLGSATMRSSSLQQSQVSALFWINGMLGLLMATIMAAVAPLAARFYGQPALIGVTTVAGLGFLFTGLAIQHVALLRRQMRMGSIAAIDVTALALGIAVGTTIAVLGGGYWALVFLQLATQAAGCVGVWVMSRWRPSRPRTPTGVRSHVSFGAGLTGFNVLAYLTRNLDNIIIGRVSGTAALGLYVKAYSLLSLPVDRLRGPASAVVIPALSRLQHDDVRFQGFFLKALTAVVAIGMPLVVFLFVFAADAVLFVLGPRWQGSVILFQVLAPAAFVETFNVVGSWACIPFGRSARLVRWQIFATLVMVTSFLVGAQWGVLGVAVAVSVSTIALRVPATLYLLEGSPVSPRELLRALTRPACASLAAGATIHAVRLGLHGNLTGGPLLMLAAPVFGALYLAMWLAWPGGREALRQLLTVPRDLAKRAPTTGEEPSGGR